MDCQDLSSCINFKPVQVNRIWRCGGIGRRKRRKRKAGAKDYYKMHDGGSNPPISTNALDGLCKIHKI